ncbi:acyltransferase [Patiriisocius hiemis]|uniref:Transferase n=1 Tax=Patiriisocius hiemis TaxID=3075604 RepID=A0ABU2YHI5_9FLAO|nr:transferase [Constantimarinum sp. W242]MDT0556720.1 transferase [Constantimarinum sp. W242]
MSFLKEKYRKFKRVFKIIRSVNWIKTLYFNFKKLPFSEAKKLPFFFYGSVKFTNISGDFILEGPLKMGMIGFGLLFEKMTRQRGIAEINMQGKMLFKNHAHFGKDVIIYVSKNGYCEFGDMGCLGSNVKLICTNRVVIGNWTGIGYESQLIDTNSHPMMDTNTKTHFPIEGEIKIGDYNAISNRVTIMLNTKTPNNCVIASNSLCNKDYSSLGENILLGGIPAKLIRNNFARDWESEKEMLKKYKILQW